MKTCVACCCTAGALAFSTPAIAGPKPKNPILVELFTSQNCPACPAANEKLIELSKSDTIFPLTWSVSYWDYLGEKDPFAQPEFNKRQRKYADHFNLRAPFTPQAVVDMMLSNVFYHQNYVKIFFGMLPADACRC